MMKTPRSSQHFPSITNTKKRRYSSWKLYGIVGCTLDDSVLRHLNYTIVLKRIGSMLRVQHTHTRTQTIYVIFMLNMRRNGILDTITLENVPKTYQLNPHDTNVNVNAHLKCQFHIFNYALHFGYLPCVCVCVCVIVLDFIQIHYAQHIEQLNGTHIKIDVVKSLEIYVNNSYFFVKFILFLFLNFVVWTKFWCDDNVVVFICDHDWWRCVWPISMAVHSTVRSRLLLWPITLFKEINFIHVGQKIG